MIGLNKAVLSIRKSLAIQKQTQKVFKTVEQKRYFRFKAYQYNHGLLDNLKGGWGLHPPSSIAAYFVL